MLTCTGSKVLNYFIMLAEIAAIKSMPGKVSTYSAFYLEVPFLLKSTEV